MVYHHHHHHNQHAARIARQILMDTQLLALQPNQQIVYEDNYTHPTKIFSEQLPAHLVQQYGVDGQQFTTLFNQLNSTIGEYAKKTSEQTTKYVILLLVTVCLGILTVGILLILVIPLVLYQITITQEARTRFAADVQPKMDQVLQGLNNAHFKANGFEWVFIRISTGIVFRLVYSAQQQPHYQMAQPYTTQQQPMNLEPVKMNITPSQQV